ncbi:hypothetical protein WMY93_029734 [Mugilogobius chulae]|uniref:Uncharacterized protein n=1 Tax=Mugilogobius chulae TaxID=88201 RepID=A0AAW0MLU9_9GOBI
MQLSLGYLCVMAVVQRPQLAFAPHIKQEGEISSIHVLASERESGDERGTSSCSESWGHEDSAEAPADSSPELPQKNEEEEEEEYESSR